MQIYFHSRLCSYLSRVPILVEGTVCSGMISFKVPVVGREKKNPQNSISLLSVFVFPTLQFFTIISALITEPSCHFSNTIHN